MARWSPPRQVLTKTYFNYKTETILFLLNYSYTQYNLQLRNSYALLRIDYVSVYWWPIDRKKDGKSVDASAPRPRDTRPRSSREEQPASECTSSSRKDTSRYFAMVLIGKDIDSFLI